jgi:MFS family permease
LHRRLHGQLDASIGQLVLPVLESDFHQHLSAISWVAIAYTLTLAMFLPVFGRLADLYGRKTLHTMGFLLFIVGSGMCGTAPDLPFLVSFRVLQAVGAALLQTNSIAIVVTAAGGRYRGAGHRSAGCRAGSRAQRRAGAGRAPHSCAQLPLGLLDQCALRVAWRRHGLVCVTADTNARWRSAIRLARRGAARAGLTALILAINQGHEWGAASPAFICCLLAPALLLPLFRWWELRQRVPLLDLQLFRVHAFWAGNLAGLLSYAMLFGTFFLIPFVAERAYHEGPLSAGLRLMVIPVALGLLSPVSGALCDRVGPRSLTGIGMMLSAGAFIWLIFATNPGAASLVPLTAALTLFGVGEGLFTSPNNSSIMAAVPERDVGQAGGILNVTRSFGTSVGVAATAAILAWRLGVTTGRIGDTLHAPPQALLTAAHYVLAMFAVFALIACALCWMSPRDDMERADANDGATTYPAGEQQRSFPPAVP